MNGADVVAVVAVVAVAAADDNDAVVVVVAADDIVVVVVDIGDLAMLGVQLFVAGLGMCTTPLHLPLIPGEAWNCIPAHCLSVVLIFVMVMSWNRCEGICHEQRVSASSVHS